MLVTEILGNLAQMDVAQRRIDPITLQWFEASRRLLRKTSQGGVDVAFKLFQEGSSLNHDDVVALDEQTVWVIQIEPCEVIVCSPPSMAEMARACYEIGNKHAPLFWVDEQLLMPYDKPMFEWLDAAGFTPSRALRRLGQPLRSSSAQGYGHSNAPTHTHAGHVDFNGYIFKPQS